MVIKQKDNRMEKKSEKNFKKTEGPCVNRPFRIRAYMDSSDVDQLLLTNLFKFEVNIFKIMMKLSTFG